MRGIVLAGVILTIFCGIYQAEAGVEKRSCKRTQGRIDGE